MSAGISNVGECGNSECGNFATRFFYILIVSDKKQPRELEVEVRKGSMKDSRRSRVWEVGSWKEPVKISG